jgi:hypothetical protein
LATTAGSGASPFILIISERISVTVSAKMKNYFQMFLKPRLDTRMAAGRMNKFLVSC